MNQVAAVALTLAKATEPAFRTYAVQTLRNAKVLAQGLSERGVQLVTGGTDNHMLVLDSAKSFGLDGRVAEEALDRIGIATNKQIIPDDSRPPLRPSGVRLGTPAATTRGMNEPEMELLAQWIEEALRRADEPAFLDELRGDVQKLCASFPVPGLD
jgi:glycine hydroxymethyltransferase